VGEFTYCFSIYRDLLEEIFYVGDCYSVQLFIKEGKCIQRIDSGTCGNFVYGICVIYDQLYVCDYSSNLIRVFRPKAGS